MAVVEAWAMSSGSDIALVAGSERVVWGDCEKDARQDYQLLGFVSDADPAVAVVQAGSLGIDLVEVTRGGVRTLVRARRDTGWITEGWGEGRSALYPLPTGDP